ncbi:MAG: hypothetical protein N3F10_07385, partial [Candidatus Bathyarchaeota archaeon]|nr:hypothetical protein [Candidatus Bathyarchaeota archaeon]
LCVSFLTSLEATLTLCRKFNLYLPPMGFTHPSPLYVFCERKIPVMLPTNPAITVKISLFHPPKTAKCTTSRTVRQTTIPRLK